GPHEVPDRRLEWRRRAVGRSEGADRRGASSGAAGRAETGRAPIGHCGIPLLRGRSGAGGASSGAMTSASLDRLLALLLAALAATGLVTLLAGSPETAWLFVLHDLLAGALAATVVLKLARSLPRAVGGRHWLRLGVAIPMSFVVVASIVAGFAWVAGGLLVWVDLGVVRWTLLKAPVWPGPVVVPLAVVHPVRARCGLRRARPDTPAR